jgi:hypothetical protein
MDPAEAKARSEQIITGLGGKTLAWLPWLDRTEPRLSSEVASRALAMHAMLQIYFGAPTVSVAAWIHENGLEPLLSKRERLMLSRPDAGLAEQERIDLYWYLEALWAFAWVGQLIPELQIEQSVGDNLALLLPNVEKGEDASVFRNTYALRPFSAVFQMLDLYFRAHWYARDGQLNGYPTGVFNVDVIMERRKALEWISDRTIDDWDDTPDST